MSRVYIKPRVHGTSQETITLSTQLILEQAEKLGVTWENIPGTKVLKLSYNGRTKYFRYQISSETSYIGFNACLDKAETKAFLTPAGIEVPKGFKIEPSDPREYWGEVFQALQTPLIVKPTHGFQGQSIFTNLTDQAQYEQAVEKCLAYSNQEDAGVMVEETFVGKEYRLLVSREKLLAAMYREPANVVGDGEHTIQQLLETKNSDPRRGRTLDFALFKIDIDDEMTSVLTEHGQTLDSVPAAGEKVYLRRVSNISRGGDSIDVTDEIHPSVAEIAVRAMNAIPELDYAGVDFMTRDITQPQGPGTYCILEINSSPGLCIHEFPFIGKPRHTDREFVFIMFPELRTTLAAEGRADTP